MSQTHLKYVIYHAHIHLAARVHVFESNCSSLLIIWGSDQVSSAPQFWGVWSQPRAHQTEGAEPFVDLTVQERERVEESNVPYVSPASEETPPALIMHLQPDWSKKHNVANLKQMPHNTFSLLETHVKFIRCRGQKSKKDW